MRNPPIRKVRHQVRHTVVLAEAVWTLKSASDQDKPAQLLAVHSLLDETAFVFDDREAIAAALSRFKTGS